MTRSEAVRHFGFIPDRSVITITGGSQGSRALNRIVLASLDYLLSTVGAQIIWQTGSAHYDEIRDVASTRPGVRLFPFIDEMGAAYMAADLVVSRAGALTLAEIVYCGKPSLLIPFPGAAADHQATNARSLEDAGAAVILRERDLTQDRFVRTVERILLDRDRLTQMGGATRSLAMPNPEAQISKGILSLVSP
ncbi:MAG: glycosyltransferase [Fidelibacterota bacterium]